MTLVCSTQMTIHSRVYESSFLFCVTRLATFYLRFVWRTALFPCAADAAIKVLETSCGLLNRLDSLLASERCRNIEGSLKTCLIWFKRVCVFLIASNFLLWRSKLPSRLWLSIS